MAPSRPGMGSRKHSKSSPSSPSWSWRDYVPTSFLHFSLSNRYVNYSPLPVSITSSSTSLSSASSSRTSTPFSSPNQSPFQAGDGLLPAPVTSEEKSSSSLYPPSSPPSRRRHSSSRTTPTPRLLLQSISSRLSRRRRFVFFVLFLLTLFVLPIVLTWVWLAKWADYSITEPLKRKVPCWVRLQGQCWLEEMGRKELVMERLMTEDDGMGTEVVEGRSWWWDEWPEDWVLSDNNLGSSPKSNISNTYPSHPLDDDLEFQERCGDWRDWAGEWEKTSMKRMMENIKDWDQDHDAQAVQNIDNLEEPTGGKLSKKLEEYEKVTHQNGLVSNNAIGNGVIVWVCDGWTECFGWGDRLRGLQTTFLLALLTNRAFVIKSDRPSPLSFHFRPSSPYLSFEYEDFRHLLLYDTPNSNSQINGTGIEGGGKRRKRTSKTIYNDSKLWRTLKQYEKWDWAGAQSTDGQNGQKGKLEEVTWIHSNIPGLPSLLLNPHLRGLNPPVAEALSKIDQRDLPGCLTRYLFRPTDRLKQNVDTIIPGLLDEQQVAPARKEESSLSPSSSQRPELVSLQVRVGDWAMKNQKKQVDESKWAFHQECLQEAEGTWLNQNRTQDQKRYFIASDSVQARNHFVSLLSPAPVFYNHNPPVHVDSEPGLFNTIWSYFWEDKRHKKGRVETSMERRKRKALEGLSGALSEWWTLLQSTVVISSRSNFAETAALGGFLTNPEPTLATLDAHSSPPPSNIHAFDSPSINHDQITFPRKALLSHHHPSLPNTTSCANPHAIREAGHGIEGWWYWCIGLQFGHDRKEAKKQGFEHVADEWCERWGVPAAINQSR